MFGNKLINTNAGGGCTDTVDLYNPFPDGGGVALYQLNGDATDVSGNYDGTATNVTYGAGEFGQAGVFNGTSSYISSATTNAFNLQTFTVSVWAKLNSFDANPVLVSNSGTVENLGGTGWNVAYYNPNNAFYLGNNGVNLTFTTTPILTNVWYHIVATVDLTSNKIKIFLNGVFENENTYNGISYNSGTRSLRIGKVGYYDELYWNGSIDQVRIFSRALRPYEVEALYTEEYCTPTIVPSEHFNTVLYTGNGTSQTITNVGFQTDFTWIKKRSGADGHLLSDTVRGISNGLYSNQTSAENTFLQYGNISTVSGAGFTVAATTDIPLLVNQSGEDYVAWNFKAGGAAVTNTDGTITSQVSANTEAGFSVVSWTGNNLANATIGHGLEDTPKVTIIKKRTSNVYALGWQINLDSSITGSEGYLNFDTSAMYTTFPNYYTSANSTVLSTNGTDIYERQYNNQTENYIAYCFAEVEGFSNFGSYVGNGSQSGPYVVLGFEPAYIMIKRTDTSGYGWYIMDSARGMDGTTGKYLFANESNAEGTLGAGGLKVYENGFQITDAGAGFNGSGGSYIYMAFAADPTTIEPSLEDSFNTVIYTGNGGTQSITGVGFETGLNITKTRTASYNHRAIDSVRGFQNYLYLDITAVENEYPGNLYGYIQNVNSTGYQVVDGSATNDAYNQLNIDYVSWNWKAAEIPAINSNGSIPSIVSANPAAGFSIVSYTGNGSAGATVGHGLGVEPNMIIVKVRSGILGNWIVYDSVNGGTNYMLLNGSIASAVDSTPWNNTNPTNTNFTLGISSNTNSANPFVAYCFAEVAGFSKFGSYTGNGSTSGPIITTGFEPAFVMIKSTDQSFSWYILDNKRINSNGGTLAANTSGAEDNGWPTGVMTFNSTGFQITASTVESNGNGNSYIYMAFANQF